MLKLKRSEIIILAVLGAAIAIPAIVIWQRNRTAPTTTQITNEPLENVSVEDELVTTPTLPTENAPTAPAQNDAPLCTSDEQDKAMGQFGAFERELSDAFMNRTRRTPLNEQAAKFLDEYKTFQRKARSLKIPSCAQPLREELVRFTTWWNLIDKAPTNFEKELWATAIIRVLPYENQKMRTNLIYRAAGQSTLESGSPDQGFASSDNGKQAIDSTREVVAFNLLHLISEAQQSSHTTKGRFSKTLGELGIQIPPKNRLAYNFEVTLAEDGQMVVVAAVPDNDLMTPMVAAVSNLENGSTESIICFPEERLQPDPLAPPVLVNGWPQCGEGSNSRRWPG